MKLRVTPFGIAVGIFWGGTVFVTTLWLIYLGFDPRPTWLTRLALDEFGYSITITGSLVGMVLGTVDGFVDGVILAWLYNLFVAWVPSSQPNEVTE
ncbi:MAG: hypothetical protein ABEK50_17525 [bacterium]